MAVTTAEQLGAELRNWRKQRNLTQAQAAQRIGLAQKAVSAVEAHTDTTSVERLFALLSALDLELEIRDRQTGSADSLEW